VLDFVVSWTLECTYTSLQAQGLCQFAAFSDQWHWHPHFLAGVLLFVTGAVINVRSDATLRRLRNNNVKQHTIPRGGLFEYVSTPHYFGEILEWTGFCVACNFSLASVAFVLYTAANLIPRGVAHHAWYLQKFQTYPRNRKAVLPFLW
jgi:3-oxo-5-alpha-steroid 4-dehydrogenase 1